MEGKIFMYIGEGAGPLGLVLAGPLFQRFIIDLKITCALRTCILQPDHFKNPSYAPDVVTVYLGR